MLLEQIDHRIRRMYAAMSEVRTSDLSAARVSSAVVGDRVETVLEFSGGRSQSQLENAVMQLVANIACLKDHLNAWCSSRGFAPPGDALINSNRDVALIHDL